VGNVELTAADCFCIRQRGPDQVFDPGILGSLLQPVSFSMNVARFIIM
jgi:hypothetical protein